MIKWLALRRFNYIDSMYNVWVVLNLLDGKWLAATAVMVMGVALSVMVEHAAKK